MRSPAPSHTAAGFAAKAGCAACAMHELCLPMGLGDGDMARLDAVIGRRRRVARAAPLYRVGTPFRYLYAIRFGHFKTCQLEPLGTRQVASFPMAGELLGLDAIGAGRHRSEAIALEDSEVCEIEFGALEALFADLPLLLRRFHQIMSEEIRRQQNLMILLGNMRAEQRFAVFLVTLAARYAARGYSSTRFELRMSRDDIANHLGLTIESISRLLARFKALGLLAVDRRGITLLDPAQLKAMAAGTAACSPLT